MSEMANTLTWSKTKFTGSGATNLIANNDLVYQIKNHLKTIGFSVVSSSDGNLNVGASDYWASGTNIVHAVAGSNHSWIVLANNSICTDYQLCIDFASATTTVAYFYVSINGTGFLGGSLTNRPIASDEVALNILNNYWTSYNSGTSPSANVFSSSDHSATTIFLGPTTVRGIWMFFKPIQAPSFWTKPNVSMVNYGTCVHGDYDTVGEEWATTNINGNRIFLGLGTLYVGSTRCLTSNTIAGSGGDYGGNWPYTPIYLLSASTSFPGWFGNVPDLWWQHNNATLVLGDFFPGDGSGQQVIIGNFAQGNDGTALSL